MTVLFPLSEDGSHKRLFQGGNKESSRVSLLSGEIQPLPKEPPLHTLEKNTYKQHVDSYICKALQICGIEV